MDTSDAHLTDENISSSRLPIAWINVLTDLKTFSLIEEKLRRRSKSMSSMSDGSCESDLRQLHDSLVKKSSILVEPQVLTLSHSELQFILAKAFTISGLLKTLFAHEAEILDTAGSKTLRHMRSDLIEPLSSSQAPDELLVFLLDVCRNIFALSQAQLEQINRELARQLEKVAAQKALVQAIREEFNILNTNCSIDSAVHRFFSVLYPQVDLAEDEIKIIVSGTMIFFALPFSASSNDLLTERFNQLREAEKMPIRKFIGSVKRFSQGQFAHFPAFGFLNKQSVKDEELQGVAQRLGISMDHLFSELRSIITILPLEEIDKYIIHDIWGHCWQASMMNFDGAYLKIADYSQPIPGNDPMVVQRFLDCFIAKNHECLLDLNAWDTFVELEICSKLPIALAPVVAEMLADVIEFKFIKENPEKSDDMPNSSMFKGYPTKLDFVLQDVSFYFRQAIKSLKVWSESEQSQARVVKMLCQQGLSEASVVKSVRLAADRWKHLEEQHYQPNLRFQPSNQGEIEVNLYSRVMLNFLSIHAAFVEAFSEVDIKLSKDLPVSGYRKLITVAVAVFWELDPVKNIWRLDEFLKLATSELLACTSKEEKD
jgi:hypothetical protein